MGARQPDRLTSLIFNAITGALPTDRFVSLPERMAAAEAVRQVVEEQLGVSAMREAGYTQGIAEGLRRADNAIMWGVTCIGCADSLDNLIAERAAGYAEGVADRRRLRAEQIDTLTRGAYADGFGDGRRKATEGATVEHGLLMPGGGYQTRWPGAERRYPLAEWIPDQQRHGGRVFTRRVIVVEGWTEVPRAAEPAREGAALGVTDKQRADPYKHFGDMRDRIDARRRNSDPDSPAAKMRSLHAQPHGSACLCGCHNPGDAT